MALTSFCSINMSVINEDVLLALGWCLQNIIKAALAVVCHGRGVLDIFYYYMVHQNHGFLLYIYFIDKRASWRLVLASNESLARTENQTTPSLIPNSIISWLANNNTFSVYEGL